MAHSAEPARSVGLHRELVRAPMKPAPLRDFCVCGATICLLAGDPDEDAEVLARWHGFHVGMGHGPCDATFANLTRERRYRDQKGRKC